MKARGRARSSPGGPGGPGDGGVDAQALERLVAGRHHDPHALLGPHVVGQELVVRAFHPDATGGEVLIDGAEHALLPLGKGGVLEARLGPRKAPFRYRLRLRFADGAPWEREDPYRFLPALGELDLHLIGEGRHQRLWEALGAREATQDGVCGTAFAVWAPNAMAVSVVGDFCGWNERAFPMRSLGASGVFELFVPEVASGASYKFNVLTRDGVRRWKADPLARAAELAPGTSSRVFRSRHAWSDEHWMRERAEQDPLRRPLSIYEVHTGSWARVPEEGDRMLTWRQLAPRLVDHVRWLGFTHIELLPVAHFPFDGSWGYQVTGYYAPTARHGDPDDFRFFVDHCHRHGIGVIVDWVPAHFPKDDWALARFDGTALYEHADPQRGEHPDWGTLIFNYGRNEVRNFLVANALYWFEEFHVDGLRVDAVASMLYLDYSREAGAWTPNEHGGRENLDAIDFLRELNAVVHERFPGAITAAEESTSWGGVTRPAHEGGLGFTFKWNMGWMHDTLGFFARDPVHRAHHLNDLSFAMLYEYHERFLMPLSHDEVVHGKGSFFAKMPGDAWQKLANLRLLYTYQWTRPGKKLLFMGSELAPPDEWRHSRSLDWHLGSEPGRAGLMTLVSDLGRLYGDLTALWRWDHDPDGFEWIDCSDQSNVVVSYLRKDGDLSVLVVLNLTPVPRADYRIGVPTGGIWRERLSTDAARYGGSGAATVGEAVAEDVPWHGRARSIRLALPPLAALVLATSP